MWLTFFGDNKDFLFKMVFNLCGLICHRDSFILANYVHVSFLFFFSGFAVLDEFSFPECLYP